MSDLSTLLIGLRNELKIDPNDKIWSTAVKTGYINQALLKIQSDGNFNWNENEEGSSSGTTVAGTAEYSLPSDFGKLYLLTFDTVPFTLDYKTTLKDALIRNPNLVQGKPCRYYLSRGKLGFDPIPDSSYTYTFKYQKKIARLEDDADEIPYPVDFDDAIVKYAAYLAWSGPRGNAQTAQQKLIDYKELVNTLRSAYLFQDLQDLTFGQKRRYRNYPYRSNVLYY